MKYDISIIVCCYGGESTINNCLNSLNNQYSEGITIEVILVDDGSKDGTANEISAFLNNKKINNLIDFKYFRKTNEGLSIARNFGINKSNSDVISFIDEDAIADKYFAQNIIQEFNTNKEINCIGGKIDLLNSDNSFAQLIQESSFSLYMKTPKSIIGTNMAYRKSFLLEIGGFQPEFVYRGDESALFAKAGSRLSILKSDKIIIKHSQPNILKKWLKTRFENGYFSAAINDFLNIYDKTHYWKILMALTTLVLPFVILIFLLINISLCYIILSIYLVFVILRFVVNPSINKVIDEYYNNTYEIIKLHKSLYIRYVVSLGYLYSDLGYIQGSMKYKKFPWRKIKNSKTLEYYN